MIKRYIRKKKRGFKSKWIELNLGSAPGAFYTKSSLCALIHTGIFSRQLPVRTN